MEEIWKDVEGFEGRYKISNYGRILSKNGIYRKFSYSRDGYSQLSLFNKKIQKGYLIHRMVAGAFINNKEKHYECRVKY